MKVRLNCHVSCVLHLHKQILLPIKSRACSLPRTITFGRSPQIVDVSRRVSDGVSLAPGLLRFCARKSSSLIHRQKSASGSNYGSRMRACIAARCVLWHVRRSDGRQHVQRRNGVRGEADARGETHVGHFRKRVFRILQ